MQQQVNRLLHVATAFLVSAGYLALATTPHVSAGILILPVAFLIFSPIGQWLDRRFAPYRQLTAAVNVLYVLSIPLLLTRVNLIDAVTGLIMYIQFYLLAHELNSRSYRYLYLMSFFLVLAAAVQSPEPAIGLVFLLYLASAIWALLLLNLKHEFAAVEGLQGRVLGRIVGTEAAAPEQTELQRSVLVSWVTLVIVGAVGITAVVFVLTPRIEAGILGRTDNTISQTGLASEVDLASAGNTQVNQTPVMHATFPDEPGRRWDGPMYWRVTTYDYYTGSSWSALSGEGRRTPLTPYRRFDVQEHESGDVLVRTRDDALRRVHQVIYYDMTQNDGLPILELVDRAELVSASRRVRMVWSKRSDFTVLLTPGGGKTAVTYDAWSEIPKPDIAALRAAPTDYVDYLPRIYYRRLTNSDLLPDTEALARRITRPYTNVYDKVNAVESWLTSRENQFVYSLTYPPLPLDHPVDAFIQQTRIGHCELFASAMALMLRCQGIPARVVSGFRGGEWSDTDQAYVIRSDMAHLWLEVYFVGQGWVRFDPSPPSDVTNQGMGAVAAFLSRQLLNAKMLWYQQVLGYDRQFQTSWLEKIGGFIGGGWTKYFTQEREVAAEQPPVTEVSWTRLILSLLTIAFLIGFLIWGRRRPARAYQPLLTPDQARARRVYALLRRKLKRFGHKCTGKTAEEIEQSIPECAIAPQATAVEVLRTYNAARFGATPLPSAEFARLRKAVRHIRRQKS